MADRWSLLRAHHDAIAALPRPHPRRIGLDLIRVGSFGLVAGIALDMPVKSVAMALLGLGLVLAHPPVHRLPGFWWAAWFGVLQVATALWHLHPFDLDGMMYTWIVPYGCAFGLLAPGVRRWAFRGCIVVLVLMLGLALAQFLAGFHHHLGGLRLATWGERLGRAGAIHGSVTFGIVMAGVLCWFLVPWRRLGCGPVVGGDARLLAGLGVVLSVMRMAMLGALAAVATFLAVRGGRRASRNIAVVGSAGAVLAVGALWLLDPDRFARSLDFEDGRFAIWATGLAVIAEQPLVGVGNGMGLQEAYLLHAPTGEPLEFGFGYFNLHSSYLTICAQHGLATLVAYVGWLVACVVPPWRDRVRTADAAALAAALVVLAAVVGCFDFFAGRIELHLPFVVGLGLAFALAIEDGAGAPGGDDGR